MNRCTHSMAGGTWSLLLVVAELRVPVCAAAFGGVVEHEPEWIGVGGATGVLPGAHHLGIEFAGEEGANLTVAARKDREGRHVGVFDANVGAGKVAAGIGKEREILEAALPLVLDEALNG